MWDRDNLAFEVDHAAAEGHGIPGRTLWEGRTRAPLTCTLPPVTASAANERDLKRRTPKSQRSIRAGFPGFGSRGGGSQGGPVAGRSTMFVGTAHIAQETSRPPLTTARQGLKPLQ